MTLAKMGKVIAYQFQGRRFDCGSVKGFVEANSVFAKEQRYNCHWCINHLAKLPQMHQRQSTACRCKWHALSPASLAAQYKKNHTA
jgi:hypothetical protein